MNIEIVSSKVSNILYRTKLPQELILPDCKTDICRHCHLQLDKGCENRQVISNTDFDSSRTGELLERTMSNPTALGNLPMTLQSSSSLPSNVAIMKD
jgi:hypothetical protein